MYSFKVWLEGHRGTFARLSLYPPLYTQFMNYPPQDVITWGADAISYMAPEDIKFKAYTGKFKPFFWKGIYSGKPTSD